MDLGELGLGFLIFAVVWCGACALYNARGWPIGMRRLAKDLRDRDQQLQGEWEAHVRDVRAFLEAIEDQAETIERKRARVEARLRTQKGPGPPENGADAEAVTREELKRRARSAGYQV